MNYSTLTSMTRAQLIEAQEQAIMTCDHNTLRRISDVLTGFDRLNREPAAPAQFTWLSAEVPDLTGDAEYDELAHSFWVD